MNKHIKDAGKKHSPLLTPKIKARFKAIGHQSNEVDPIVVAKLIHGDHAFEIYLIDYYPEINFCLGYRRDLRDKDYNPSFQAVNVSVLEQRRGDEGIRIELDPDFKECRLSECVKELRFKIRMEKLKQKREDKERNKDQDIDISSDI